VIKSSVTASAAIQRQGAFKMIFGKLRLWIFIQIGQNSLAKPINAFSEVTHVG
jgi:hypothetical protein